MGKSVRELNISINEYDMAHFIAELLWTVDAAASDFMREILLNRELWPKHKIMKVVADIMDNS
jgi:hypothetical protein